MREAPDTAAGERPSSGAGSFRRPLAWALVASLCVAALAAIGAIVSGGFGETDGRVIASSLFFAVFSATAAAGASLRFRGAPALRALGRATVVLSAAGFVVGLVALWNDGSEAAWRWFGCITLAALACSHASRVTGARRASDSATIGALSRVSIALAAIDAGAGILAVSGVVDEVGDGFARILAVLVVLLLLTTVLPPVLRRFQQPTEPVTAGTATLPLAAEVLAAADRIEALSAGPGNRAPEIRRECERLRELGRAHSR